MELFKKADAPSMMGLVKMFGFGDGVLADVSAFMAQWIEFMNTLRRQLVSIECKLDTVDCKVTALLTDTNITPELQAEVFAWVPDDPRNIGELKNGPPR